MTEPTTKSWLQRLKDESWEAELIVSVASTFAIFKAFGFLDWMVDFFINQLNPSQYYVGYMICFLGYVAFGILGAFFVIHFGLRAYWIGIVGLNSVFPDYNVEDSPYSKIYSKRMAEKLPKLTMTIDRLDEICSVIFSAAFTLLLIYFYFGLISSLYLLLYNALADTIPAIYLLIPAILLISLLILSTLISVYANLKQNKEKDSLQLWYYKIAIAQSVIMYGPLYKSLLQTSMIFGTNFKKKKSLVKVILAMVLFGFSLGIYQIFQSNVLYLLDKDDITDTTRIYPHHYQINNEASDFLLAPEIQRFTLKDEAVDLFIPLYSHETRLIKKDCKALESASNFSIQERWAANLTCFSEVLDIKINDKPINPNFFKINHPKTDQFGLQTTIDTDNLLKGDNILTIQKSIAGGVDKKWLIAFQYQ